MRSKTKKYDRHLHIRYDEATETELFALAKKSRKGASDYLRLLIEYASKNKIKL